VLPPAHRAKKITFTGGLSRNSSADRLQKNTALRVTGLWILLSYGLGGVATVQPEGIGWTTVNRDGGVLAIAGVSSTGSPVRLRQYRGLRPLRFLQGCGAPSGCGGW